ncbi:DnaA regulatory inactivator Hda [Methylophaga thiooxydans]|uniref:DnaA regulatory inactivator Hda n=1 Tax=Methylophaga thiooxydans TaxID=392484 RepID=UPI002355CBA6|nr:DnaA regulatory inactivator Hda [Methylophaga thiooxydans]
MSVAKTQLTLRLSPQEIYHFDNYLFAKTETERALESFCRLDNLDFLYLYGETGTGKTHLLIACAEKVQKLGFRVIYLSLAELIQTSEPAVLQSLEQADLLCLDDLEAIAGNKEWEVALFHCFNRLHDAKGSLLVAAEHNPANSQIQLPDLCSRLATGLVYQLTTMSDEQKQQALILQSQKRGLTMNDDVAQYLLRHYGRDMPALMSVLQQLDKASLQAKRKLTIPFIRQVLASG